MYFAPTGGLLALTAFISITTYLEKMSNKAESHCKLNLSLITVNILISMITVIVCAIQIFFLSSQYAEICSHISIVERLSWRKLAYNSNTFKWIFMRKVIVTVLAYFWPIPFSWCLWSRLVLFASNITLKAFVLMILIQALFYIELLDYMLKCFIDAIATNSVNVSAVKAITVHDSTVQQLKIEIAHYKLVHFHLWCISQKINKLFGWIIVVIVLQYFVFVICNVSWAFKMIYLKGFLTEFIRKLISVETRSC